MIDDKFDLLQATASEISDANTRYQQMVAQRNTLSKAVAAANEVFDKAISSHGMLDITGPQRHVIDQLTLLTDSEKRLLVAREKLVDACAAMVAECFFS